MKPGHETSGRVALVTGGSRGIGAATCMGLAAKGVRVAVHFNRHRSEADTVVASIRDMGGEAIAIAGDFHDPDAPGRIVAAAVEAFGTLSILVNNAGLMTDSPVETMSDDLWEACLAVNLSATFRCVRASIPHMRQAHWGRIVNLSSQAARTGSRSHAHYAAAKAGLLGLTSSLARELGREEITANLVSPGRIETAMLRERSKGRLKEWLQQTPIGRLGTPEEVAAAIIFLASEEAGYITGADIPVNGGLITG